MWKSGNSICKMGSVARGALLLLCWAVLPVAIAQIRQPTDPNANLPAQRIGATDLVAISVYDAPELTRTVRVGADGYMRLPMLKQRIKAEGLMPSELESFGLAALEAMACKVPTIATRVGGVSELIEDGVTGRLFAVGDVAAMAAAAIDLLADDARLDSMRDAGRRVAQDHYCASHIIPVYERYYERVLARAEV